MTSALDGGNTWYLTVFNDNRSSGTNIELNTANGGTGQQFMFQPNSDGTYTITTKNTGGGSAVEVEGASLEDGGNVRQWASNGHDCQKWILEPTEGQIPGDTLCDSQLNVFDLSVMKRHIADENLSFVNKAIGDVTADGIFDAADVRMLQDYLLCRIKEFPAKNVTLPQNTILPVSVPEEDAKPGERGVVAVRTGNEIFISWKLMSKDSENVTFDVYRVNEDGTEVKLNVEPLTGGTNYTDTTADITKPNGYYVVPSENGIPTGKSGTYTVNADTAEGPVVVVPIKEGSTIKNVWTADFNGDDRCDFLVDRNTEDHQLLEAYLNDGTYLWTINMGVNSEDKYRIEPGSATIDIGHWDGATATDMNGDGKAEVMLKIANGVTFGDGTLRYSLADEGIGHGDRFYIGKFNKADKVMMGYGIQQDNTNLLAEYYYNASTGEVLWKHYLSEMGDVGRGNVADIDPTMDGMEAWSFSGIYNAKTNTLLSDAAQTMWPAYTLYWDDDLLAESYNNGKFEEWDYVNKSVGRIMTAYKIHDAKNDDDAFVLHYGDIMGDWREEVIATNYTNSELVIFTTNIPTDYRITCLAEDPAYRNCLTIKGYKQSHMLSFYMGSDMYE